MPAPSGSRSGLLKKPSFKPNDNIFHDVPTCGKTSPLWVGFSTYVSYDPCSASLSMEITRHTKSLFLYGSLLLAVSGSLKGVGKTPNIPVRGEFMECMTGRKLRPNTHQVLEKCWRCCHPLQVIPQTHTEGFLVFLQGCWCQS